ncbi:MAG: hypothetical protein WEB87_03640 [Bacteriovoracaceae bacterium]
MNKEYFKILKEINSLEQKMASLTAINQEESFRVDKLKQKKDEALQDLEALELEERLLKQKSQKIENRLAALDSRGKKLDADLKGNFDGKQAPLLEKEKAKVALELEDLENQGLENLEKLEELEAAIQDKKTFIAGVAETIEEIGLEVGEIVVKNENAMKTLEKRIENSLQEVPANFQSVYSSLRKKAMPVSLFASIQNRKCSICKMSVDWEKEAKVEEKMLLKTCSNCGRIFIPKESLY